MVYRIDGATMARQQAQWFVLGLVLFAGTVIVFRDYRKLENYRYLIVIASLVLLVLPRVPGLERPGQRRLPGDPPPGRSPSSRPSSPRSGWSSSSPATCATTARRWPPGRKILGYRCRRSSTSARCCCSGALAMLILVVLHDIGSSLMFYGGLLAILYVATDRISFVLVGLVAFAARRLVPRHAHPAHRRARSGLAAPVQPDALQRRSAAATRSPTRSSRRPPAACSARASARRC